jgi:hypothetical protein
MISAETIQADWDRHLSLIDKFISEPRKAKVLEMYSALEDVMVTAPASGNVSYHNAFPGGYINHVNRVTLLAFQIKKVWQSAGASINFTDEELAFSAIMHDLGKIGDGNSPGYLEQDDKWRKDKLGEVYKNNTDLDFMLMQDRSLFLLQKFGIQCSINEFIAIRVHDGLYDDTNKPYYISFKPESKFKTSLPLILHQADLAASKIELDLYK